MAFVNFRARLPELKILARLLKPSAFLHTFASFILRGCLSEPENISPSSESELRLACLICLDSPAENLSHIILYGTELLQGRMGICGVAELMFFCWGDAVNKI